MTSKPDVEQRHLNTETPPLLKIPNIFATKGFVRNQGAGTQASNDARWGCPTLSPLAFAILSASCSPFYWTHPKPQTSRKQETSQSALLQQNSILAKSPMRTIAQLHNCTILPR